MNTIYDNQVYFKLINNGVDIPAAPKFVNPHINEPVNWDSLKIITPRDPKTYGFTSEFIDGNTDVIFPYANGGNEIKDIIEAQGAEALVFFEFGILNGTTEQPLYQGRINLYEYTRDDIGVYATIEKTTFRDTINNNFDTAITLNSNLDLFNQLIAACTPITLYLHSKALIKVLEVNNAYGTVRDVTYAPSVGTWLVTWVGADTNTVITHEMETLYHLPMSINTTTPVDHDLYHYLVREAGALEVTVDISFDLELSATVGVSSPTTGNCFVIVQTGNSSVKYDIPFIIVGSTFGPGGGSIHAGGVFNVTVDVYDHVYVGCQIAHGAMYAATVLNYHNNIVFKQVTIAPESTAQAYRLFDVVTYMINSITDTTNRFVSNFFGTGGAGEMYAITNGFFLRNFAGDTLQAPKISMKDLTDALQSEFNIGVGYKNIDGLDYIFFEPMLSFFGSIPILNIDSVYNFKENYLKQYIYNEVDIKYNKYGADQLKYLDDFLTEHSYLLPIKAHKSKLTLNSQLTASGDLIEIIRRDQFQSVPSTSLTDDNTVFIIAYYEDSGHFHAESNQPFDVCDGVNSPETIYNGRLSVKHMMYNQAPLLNIGLKFNADSDVIINTSIKNNGNFRSKFSGAEPNPLFVGTEEITEKDNILLSDFAGRGYAFTPFGATFSALIGWSDMQLLKNALSNQLPGNDVRNNGCIVAPDDYGKKWLWAVMNISYQPATGETDFTCAKIQAY